MKRFLLLSVLVSVLVSCSARKQMENAISNGNYDQAINNALKKLENNKDKKRKQDYIVMLRDAYNKVLEADLQKISELKQNGNPQHYKLIYNTYLDLEARQNAIRRILPLKINGKTLSLNFYDYSSEIVDFRNKTSLYLVEQGTTLLDSKDKFNARKAYSIFSYVKDINPYYNGISNLMTEAHKDGIDYVYVSIINQTQQIMPERLENELLDFNTYGLNQFWTDYDTIENDAIDYDFAMQLQLKQINISPERVNESKQLREREIVDGWEYLLDPNGNVAKDSLGNDIKIDKIIKARARFVEILQTKSAQIIADVVYTDLKQHKTIDAFTIDSSFAFENTFGRFRGDKRALSKVDKTLIREQEATFPSNAQMVYATGEDLKIKLKAIIKSYHLNS